MADSHSIEYMREHPHCSFCRHSYIKLFKTWCTQKSDCRNLCAKTCAHYTPITDKKVAK